MKQFIFLYPIPEIVDFEIKFGARRFNSKSEFKEIYKKKLNECIDERYRKKEFKINYAIFNDTSVSKIINLKKDDKIIKAGLDFKTHTTKQKNGQYLYPDQDYILNQLSELGNANETNKISELRVAGFHMWDCVEKLAKRAYETGINTLVDEDLTENFAYRLKDPNFRTDKYPTYNPRKDNPMFDLFMEVRKGKPWLWQDY